MTKLFRSAALAGVAIFSIAATGNWLATVAQTDGGHRLGNPEAALKLTQFVSYTCNHCANFERQSEGAIKLMYVQPGTASVEVRHLIRDPIDLTAAMLTNCGAKEKFFGNHSAIMLSQDEWLPKAQAATSAQRNRWATGSNSSRRRAIASDLGFYDIMEDRGYSRVDADRCLTSDEIARKIATQSAAGSEKFGVNATPSFVINGKLQDRVHSWAALQTAIANALK